MTAKRIETASEHDYEVGDHTVATKVGTLGFPDAEAENTDREDDPEVVTEPTGKPEEDDKPAVKGKSK